MSMLKVEAYQPRPATTFGSLEIGRVFSCEQRVYVKLSMSVANPTAVCLYDPDPAAAPYISRVSDNVEVTPVKEAVLSVTF